MGWSSIKTNKPKALEIGCPEESDGLYVTTTVQDEEVEFLIDTGANITILSEDFVHLLKPEQILCIKEIDKYFMTATGEESPFLGKAMVNIQIGGQRFEHEIWIANIKNEGIMGADFLEKNHCDILFSERILKINGEKVDCFTVNQSDSLQCYRIRISETTGIPPLSESVIPGHCNREVKLNTPAVLRPTENFSEKCDLLMAKELVNLENDVIPLRVMNITDRPQVLYKDSLVCMCEPVSEIMDFLNRTWQV